LRRLERMKHLLDPDFVAEVYSASDEETDAAIAEEIRKMKLRNPQRWQLFFASMPTETQEMLRDIERRFGV
ncbi:MAG: hypothetical protein RMM28_11830, partial [Thermoleophilia bacterium]|nr:hypothetical protein [Gaiellaceae bacterium]MDW8339816.1 hypothetical protein [Thermoleophilia bacterium]